MFCNVIVKYALNCDTFSLFVRKIKFLPDLTVLKLDNIKVCVVIHNRYKQRKGYLLHSWQARCIPKLSPQVGLRCNKLDQYRIKASDTCSLYPYFTLTCSFGMSENYIIMTEQPAYLNILNYLGTSMFGKAGGKMQVVVTDKDEKVYLAGSF